MQQDAGSKCFGKEASSADWAVDVDYRYDGQANKTVYTFTVDALDSSICGSPDSLSVRLRDSAPAVKTVRGSNARLRQGCDRSSGMRSTLKWTSLKLQQSSSDRRTAAVQVAVNGNVPDLCQRRVHIVDSLGRTVAESADSECSFVISSQRCCRHGFAEMPAALLH